MIIAWCLLAGLASVHAGAQDDSSSSEVPFQLDTHASLTAELKRIAEAHPDVATLHLLGRSRGERTIEALRLTGPARDADGGDTDLRPGLLLVANLQGPRVFESAVALDHARRLAEGYASDEAVRSLLDTTVVWIVPRANPDAAEARFETPLFERWAGTTGIDNDRDGRQGEDPVADVDGDGQITWMRVPDPDGEWMADPTDERASIEADRNKGERGVWKIVREGRDLDGDEEASEDAPGDTRVDRNFPAGWEEHEAHAGLYPTDEPEVKGLIELVLANDNLALVVTYDGLDNLVDEPKSVDDDANSVKRVPPAGVLQSDADLLTEIGSRYREATDSEAKGGDPDEGTFQRWAYEHRGLITLNAVLWNMPTEAPAAEEEEGEEAEEEGDGDEDEDAEDEDAEDEDDAEPSEDAKHLLWVDGAGEDARFVAWTPFEHPELGPVEIGGFAPFARIEPPQSEWAAISEKNFEFFLTLGELLPRLAITECTAEELGDGVWKVSAVVENDAYLPLLSRSARRTRTTRPARVRIVLPDVATLLSGRVQELLLDLPGSGGRHEYTWLVHGPDGMELGVSVDSDHAGEAFQKAEVKS